MVVMALLDWVILLKNSLVRGMEWEVPLSTMQLENSAPAATTTSTSSSRPGVALGWVVGCQSASSMAFVSLVASAAKWASSTPPEVSASTSPGSVVQLGEVNPVVAGCWEGYRAHVVES